MYPPLTYNYHGNGNDDGDTTRDRTADCAQQEEDHLLYDLVQVSLAYHTN
jgi:hypothetical protein